MKEFKKFYLFGMNAKFYMGICFAAIVMIVSIVKVIFGETFISVWTLLEILLTSLIIGFSQAIILKDGTDYSKGIFFKKSFIWLLLSETVIMSIAYIRGWFLNLPLWAFPLCGIFMLFGFCAMLFGQKFLQEEIGRASCRERVLRLA